MYAAVVDGALFKNRSLDDLINYLSTNCGPEADGVTVFQSVGTVKIGASFVPEAEPDLPPKNSGTFVKMMQLSRKGKWHVVDLSPDAQDDLAGYYGFVPEERPVLCGAHWNTIDFTVSEDVSGNLSRRDFCSNCENILAGRRGSQDAINISFKE